MRRERCLACNSARQVPPGPRKGCRECRGVGYFEIKEAGDCRLDPTKCKHASFDPMTGGWECSTCGDSGPLRGQNLYRDQRS